MNSVVSTIRYKNWKLGILSQKNLVLVDGVRTPFQVQYSGMQHMEAQELLVASVKELVKRTNVPKDAIDYHVSAYVYQDPKLTNVARDVVLLADLPHNIPAHSLCMACNGGFAAIATACDAIVSGQSDVVIASGSDMQSNLPFWYSKPLRLLMAKKDRAKTSVEYQELAELIKAVNIESFQPVTFGMTEFTTKELLGIKSEKDIRRLNLPEVTKKAVDEYGLKSHMKAQAASEQGLLIDKFPMNVRSYFDKDEPDITLNSDNGIRVAPIEKISKLQPAFFKGGWATAANSSYLTDGAAATLITTEDKALELGLKPKAYIRDIAFASGIVSAGNDSEGPFGKCLAIAKLIKKYPELIEVQNFDVFEYHEAFSHMIIGALQMMDNEAYCKNNLHLKKKFGMIPEEKLNRWGGSVAVGHPMGATGIRVMTTAANRLIHEDGSLALAASCAYTAQGVAAILERHPLATADF